MIFDKLFRKEKKENNQIVVGVVYPGGAGGVGGIQLSGEDLWSFSFAICPWRDSISVIHNTQLIVIKKKITDIMNSRNIDWFDAYSIWMKKGK